MGLGFSDHLISNIWLKKYALDWLNSYSATYQIIHWCSSLSSNYPFQLPSFDKRVFISGYTVI